MGPVGGTHHLVYPIWWSSMPSLMKGWIDRVFTPGIALLANDQALYLNYLSEAKNSRSCSKGKQPVFMQLMAPTCVVQDFSGPSTFQIVMVSLFEECSFEPLWDVSSCLHLGRIMG